MIILSFLAWILPLVLVIMIVRAFSHRGHKDQKDIRHATFRDVMLSTVGLAAGYAGVFTIYYLPAAVAGSNSDNTVFAGRLLLSVALLVGGLMLKRITGVFLMIMGIAGLVLAAPFAFDHLGSVGALVAAAIAFAVLVFFAIRMSKKAQPHG